MFRDEAEYEAFTERHDRSRVRRGDLSTYEGNCFLGIDAGSTTTKVALVGEDGSLLYSFYSSNNGSPLATAIRAMKEINEPASCGRQKSPIPAPPATARRC